jgi:hypothetical protein
MRSPPNVWDFQNEELPKVLFMECCWDGHIEEREAPGGMSLHGSRKKFTENRGSRRAERKMSLERFRRRREDNIKMYVERNVADGLGKD